MVDWLGLIIGNEPNKLNKLNYIIGVSIMRVVKDIKLKLDNKKAEKLYNEWEVYHERLKLIEYGWNEHTKRMRVELKDKIFEIDRTLKKMGKETGTEKNEREIKEHDENNAKFWAEYNHKKLLQDYKPNK